jgi:hypothetical protein
MCKQGHVERFARTYMLVPEIQRRARLSRARDVRAWLAERSAAPEFELGMADTSVQAGEGAEGAGE